MDTRQPHELPEDGLLAMVQKLFPHYSSKRTAERVDEGLRQADVGQPPVPKEQMGLLHLINQQSR